MQELFNQLNPVNLETEIERARDAAREYYTDDPDTPHWDAEED